MALVGLVAAADYGRRLYLGRQSRQWVSTSGKVIRSGTVRLSHRSGGHTIANIVYEYTVQNVTYKGKAIGYREPLDSAGEDGERLHSRYPKGKPLRVWYDPNHPRRAVLQPGSSRGSFLVLLGWLIFAAFWSVFFYLTVRAA